MEWHDCCIQHHSNDVNNGDEHDVFAIIDECIKENEDCTDESDDVECMIGTIVVVHCKVEVKSIIVDAVQKENHSHDIKHRWIIFNNLIIAIAVDARIQDTT